jgi:hypothetical protein
MKVSIIGSRDFTSYETFNSELEKLNLDITSIVSGGAIGTDTLAEQYANKCKKPYQSKYQPAPNSMFPKEYQGYRRVTGGNL